MKTTHRVCTLRAQTGEQEAGEGTGFNTPQKVRAGPALETGSRPQHRAMKSIFVLRLGPLDGELVSRAAACLVSARPESAVAVGGGRLGLQGASSPPKTSRHSWEGPKGPL